MMQNIKCFLTSTAGTVIDLFMSVLGASRKVLLYHESSRIKERRYYARKLIND